MENIMRYMLADNYKIATKYDGYECTFQRMKIKNTMTVIIITTKTTNNTHPNKTHLMTMQPMTITELWGCGYVSILF